MSEASAQSITITNKNNLTRRTDRPAGLQKTTISQADCRAEDFIGVLMTVNFTSLQNPRVAVYATTSGDCNDAVQRTNVCWEVASTTTFTGPFNIPVQKIIKPPTDGSDICSAADSATVTLYFLLMDGANPKANTTLSVAYDLSGPAAPTGLSIGVGEGRLYPRWKIDSTITAAILRYEVYCEEANPDLNECTSPNLKPGETPPADLYVSRTDTRSGQAEAPGLTDGVYYACGVAALDNYENVGNLSELVCGTPEPVTGYYDAYRAAGGRAGGGFCSFGRQAATTAGSAFFVLVAAGSLLRRSTRLRRSETQRAGRPSRAKRGDQ